MYYPVLRWKEGEQGALQNLSSRTRQLITPIIDFPSCDYSVNRIRDFNETAAKIMPTMLFYLDLGEVSSNESGADSHPALSLMRDANAHHLSFIPIIRPNCEDDFITVIQQALADGIINNIAIRVFESDGNMLSFNDIAPVLTAVGTTIEETDLILDIKEVNGRIAAQTREVAWYIGDLGNSYRRTIMIGGSMPADIYKYIAEDSTGAFSRHEWQLWNTIRQNSSTQHLEYGDYATVQVHLSDAQFSGSPRIKYTLDNSWFVARGHKQRRGKIKGRSSHEESANNRAIDNQTIVLAT